MSPGASRRAGGGHSTGCGHRAEAIEVDGEDAGAGLLMAVPALFLTRAESRPAATVVSASQANTPGQRAEAPEPGEAAATRTPAT